MLDETARNDMRPARYLLLLWLIALFTWWVRYHPWGLDGVVLEDDTRQHVYWTARFQDPGLFPDDPMTRFASSLKIAPLGYQWVYRAGTFFMDPLTFSQVLSLILLLATLWLLDGLLSLFIPEARVRFFLGLLFLLYLTHNVVHNVLGGFQRSFAFPLFLGFLILLRKGYFKSALSLVLAEALFYPAIVPNTLAMGGAALLASWKEKPAWGPWLAKGAFLAGVTLLTFAVLHAIYWMGGADFSGSPMTLETARAMPEFHEGGRTVFFRDNPLAYWLTGRSGVGVLHLSGFLVLAVFLLAILGFSRFKTVPLAFHLVWTSLVLFASAHLTLFRLYLPSRYTYYTLSLALLLLIGVNAKPAKEVLLDRIPFLKRRKPRASRWMAAAAAVLLLSVYGAAQSFLVCRADPRLVVLEREDLEMLRFLESLPKDALVAGHPLVLDNVPLMASRKVVANLELALPYYAGYYELMRKRLLDLLQAYYAHRWEEVRAFVASYGVDALVIGKLDFNPSSLEGPLATEPFNALVRREMESQGDFALEDPPAELRCFENAAYSVLCFQGK